MTSKDILVVGKVETVNNSTNDVNYYLQLSNYSQIAVSKEEFYLNIIGTKLRLESEVAYK